MQAFTKMDASTSQASTQHSVISSPSPSKNITSNASLYQRYNLSPDNVTQRFVHQAPPYNMGHIAQYRDNPYSRVQVPNDFSRQTPIISSGNNSVSGSGGIIEKNKLFSTMKPSENIINTKQKTMPTSQQVIISQQPESVTYRQSPPDPGGELHSFKMIKFLYEPKNIPTMLSHNIADHYTNKNFETVPISKNLNVDIKDNRLSNETYNPQVEAISPTISGEMFELGMAKDDLIMQINKVDSELAVAEKNQYNIVNRIAVLGETSNKIPHIKSKLHIHIRQHQNIVHKIYEENRKKAAIQHSIINSVYQSADLPIYNQPTDVTTCDRINNQFQATFKCRLVVFLKKIKMEKSNRHNALANEYRKLSNDWNKKVEKIESNAKRKAKEIKNREFFEKVFVELRKQREEKERFNRVGSRVKSEADLEEIMDGLQEQALEDKKMRSYAVIPPLMLEKNQRNFIYHNENGIIVDMIEEYKSKQRLNLWTSGEKEIFKEKYLQHPKNFGLIAASLERKSVQDCIRYYYLNKKIENYKQLLRKSRQRTRSSRNPQKTQQSQTQCIIDSLTTGVTTRLQREQQHKTFRTSNLQISVCTEKSCSDNSKILFENKLTPDDVGASKSEIDEKIVKTEYNGNVEIALDKNCETSKEKSEKVETSEIAIDNNIIPTETQSQESTTTGTVIEATKIGDSVNICFVCKNDNTTRTRPLKKGRGSKYGINDDLLPHGARVCNSCVSKSHRDNYKKCQIPTCKHYNDNVVKQLYNFATRLSGLNDEERDKIYKEFSIPENVTKCCNLCLSKLNKKIDPLNECDYKHNIDSDFSNSTCDDEDFEVDPVPQKKNDIRCSVQVTNDHPIDIVDDKKLHPPPSHPRKRTKPTEEYDSSATETADEENEISPGNRQSPKANSQQNTARSDSSLNVRDFLYNFIERQLKVDPSRETYIKNPRFTNKRFDLPASKNVCTLDNTKEDSCKPVNNEIKKKCLTEESDNGHLVCSEKINLTPTLTDGMSNKHQYENKYQKPNSMENEEQTLDLSLRKMSKNPSPIVNNVHTSPSMKVPSSENLVCGQYRNSTTPNVSYLYPITDTPISCSVRSVSQQASAIFSQSISKQTQMQKSPKQTSLGGNISTLSSKGSITHGTPFKMNSTGSQMNNFNQHASFNKIENKSGSITQGTPVLSSANQYDLPKSNVMAPTLQAANQNTNKYNKQPYANNAMYGFDASSKLASKQLVMQDYMTSQQMQQKVLKGEQEEIPNRNSNIASTYFSEKDKPNSPRRVSPHRRQGVIQRHTKSPSFSGDISHSYPLSGHEAFSSLVEVAAQQPQLPVPAKEQISSENLTYRNADLGGATNEFNRHLLERNISDKEEQRKQFANNIFPPNSNVKSTLEREKETFNRLKGNDTQLSAQKLIDAIIIQSINQGTSDSIKYCAVRDIQHQNNSINTTSEPTNIKENQSKNMLTSSFDREQKLSSGNNDPIFTKSITIGDLTNSIITKDYSSNSGNIRQIISPYNDHWKGRRSQKMYDNSNENIKSIDSVHSTNPNMKFNELATVSYYNSQPQTNINGSIKAMDRNIVTTSSAPPPIGTNNRSHPFTLERYVKNKIVEVMRIEDERPEDVSYEHNDKSNPQQMEHIMQSNSISDNKRKDNLIKRHDDFSQFPGKSLSFSSGPQYYPYSALTVQNQTSTEIMHPPTSSMQSSSIEPKPLLSAQYEALSDEE